MKFDRGRAPDDPVGEEPQREHRLAGAPLPADEQHGGHHDDGEVGDGVRRAPREVRAAEARRGR